MFPRTMEINADLHEPRWSNKTELVLFIHEFSVWTSLVTFKSVQVTTYQAEASFEEVCTNLNTEVALFRLYCALELSLKHKISQPSSWVTILLSVAWSAPVDPCSLPFLIHFCLLFCTDDFLSFFGSDTAQFHFLPPFLALPALNSFL